jgi:hypothetical protein
MEGLVVYCADVGSIPRKRFGWARGTVGGSGRKPAGGGSIEDLVREIKKDLSKAVPVALGFECPLWAPFREKPKSLAKARAGEGNRPWSAGAGAASLATGLSQVPWILRSIRPEPPTIPEAFLDWEMFCCSGSGLFLWEAFVSGKAKSQNDTKSSHEMDATAAVRWFIDHVEDLSAKNAVREDKVFSLLGAALLRTGWSRDLALLEQSCLVLRAPSRSRSRSG